MTEQEYLALARQKYQELQNLKEEKSFYTYEKTFDEIWTDLGRQVLEKNLSELPADRRKKKLSTKVISMQIANSELFNAHSAGFKIIGYYGSICATYFGRMMPVIAVQNVPVYSVVDYLVYGSNDASVFGQLRI